MENEKTGIKDIEDNTKIINRRKEQINKFLNKNNYVFIFAILGAVFLISSILIKLKINVPFIASINFLNLIIFGIIFAISAVIAYYGKFKQMFYVLLAGIIWIAVFIRTRNLANLKDITTGTWTLGPDLDPFLFLRWAEYIVEHGKLMVIDTMRYVPLGYDTSGEMKLLSYMIAWLYQFLSIFSKEITVTYTAVIFPVVMFALTIIAFFFLTREIFWDKFEDKKFPNLIALIASFFLSVIPVLLPRTIAGIPEKESASFFIMFLCFYFFIKAFKAQNYRKSLIFGALSGITTAWLGLIWGGVSYIFITIGLAVFILFLSGQINLRRVYIYSIWIAVSFLLMHMFSTRYTFLNLFTSIDTGFSTLILLIMLTNIGINKTSFKRILNNPKLSKLPTQIISTVIVFILIFLGIIVFLGPDFIAVRTSQVYYTLISPATSRLIQTVAENRQPYFDEWAGNFGPSIKKIALFFWLFFVGSIYLFYQTIRKLKIKHKIILTSTYFIFLFSIIFSRYGGSSIFNGENFISLFVYFGGVILFVISLIYVYIKIILNRETEILKTISLSNILLFCFFVLGIISARGAVRGIMMLAPPTSIIVAYFVVNISKNLKESLKSKDELSKMASLLVIGLILTATLFSGYSFYNSSIGQANGFYPSTYTWQWQRAMAWVRDNTPENSVFGHWWDYGYWVQSIGKRATIVDGGNAISYWNHLMGREVLTAPNDTEALTFLYTHNATHYLIDSSEIGKYGAYSKIGSDANYDRISFIPSFTKDDTLTQESKESITKIYRLNAGLDEDIIWEENGIEYIFPKENSGIAAVLIEENNKGELLQPKIIIVKQDIQLKIPLKYIYHNGRLKKFDSGLEAGVFLMDTVILNPDNSIGIAPRTDGLYLSKRTINSFFVRKYLFGEEGNFKLVHSEPNYIIEAIGRQWVEIPEIVKIQGIIVGPIKIWEIQYPEDIKVNPEYLKTEYPTELA